MTRTVNDTVEEIRMSVRSLDALADALGLTPDNCEWLRLRIAESKEDTHGRALAESRIMLGLGFSKAMRLSILAKRYYAGNGFRDGQGYGPLARVVVSDVPPAVKAKADLHEAWLRGDPKRFAKYLASLPQI